MEKRSDIYDNIKIGIRGLTVIIMLGLLILSILMLYGYYAGIDNTVNAEVFEAVPSEIPLNIN